MNTGKNFRGILEKTSLQLYEVLEVLEKFFENFEKI